MQFALRIAARDLTSRPGAARRGSFGTLDRALNQIAGALAEADAALERKAAELVQRNIALSEEMTQRLLAEKLLLEGIAAMEQRVSARMQELQSANEQLHEDIDARMQSERALTLSVERFRHLAYLSSDWYWEQDAQFRFTVMSQDGKTGTKSSLSHFIGKTRREMPIMLHGPQWEAHEAVLAAHQAFSDFEYKVEMQDKTLRWVSITGQPLFDASGAFTGYRGMGRDITDRKQSEEKIRHMAFHDSLTGLPNRALLQDRLNQAIAHASRQGHSFWVVFIDLDRFKFVNDSLGHEAGDMHLRTISARLQSILRQHDSVARLGGDEFVVVLPDIPKGSLSSSMFQRILNTVAEPASLLGQEVVISCSIGAASYPIDGATGELLIERADVAMYRAKRSGGNNFQFYAPAMNEGASERLNIESGLRRALRNAEFVLHYQPQVDLRSGEIVGMEALVRWQHPEQGLIAPARFITIAEQSGLIVPIGMWVLKTACAQNQAWQMQGYPPMRIAVNLSARQFNEPDLVNAIAMILEETGLPASCLDIELTESMVMTDIDRAIEVLHALRALGVKLSIDDFGTGYSSLSYLKQFPIDMLKIDQSFVRQISSNCNDAAIPNAIISMAHSLGIRVIAEGVETDTQCEILAQNLCDEIQGYLFSAPAEPDEIALLLKQARMLPERLRSMQKRPRTLLLVDDEPNILAALKRQIRGAGYRIITAGNGQEGLDLLAVEEIDVIVSDQRMPGMTGVEFLRTVKTLYPDTVRIVLSGFTELQSVTDAVNEGAIYKFLTKPWDDKQLRGHIEEAFQHREMAAENRRLDLAARSANQELAHANRQLEEMLKQKQQQIQHDGITLDIVREALQYVPLPIIGLDDDEVVAFANISAQELFRQSGQILGSEAQAFIPDILRALRGTEEGGKCRTELDGRPFEVVSRSMGKDTRSRGKLITFRDVGVT
ncbi:MAG: EAL domain-containing protein [Noviherbaspirillum sp.]